ncbi:uncharacterized protein [Nicotiana sylvestris]|uniref:uncharacterized protein n=1 Tax=Nicotiana sylvestris TaxID=4096 RepID=UPI00388C5AAC
MGSLAYILVGERTLALDVLSMDNQFVRLDVSDLSRVLACTVAWCYLFEHLRDRQYDDPHLLILRDIVWHDDAKKVTVGDDGVLRMQGCIYVPNVDGLCELILEEAHYSRFLFIRQIKYKHQTSGDLLQKIEIPEWKWERISMDFVVGLLRIRRKFDAVRVIVDRLTKSAHFIPVTLEEKRSLFERILRSVFSQLKETAQKASEVSILRVFELESRVFDYYFVSKNCIPWFEVDWFWSEFWLAVAVGLQPLWVHSCNPGHL